MSLRPNAATDFMSVAALNSAITGSSSSTCFRFKGARTTSLPPRLKDTPGILPGTGGRLLIEALVADVAGCIRETFDVKFRDCVVIILERSAYLARHGFW